MLESNKNPRTLALFFLAFALTLVSLAGTCHSEVQTIEQMLHGSWAGHNGAPQAIHALSAEPGGLLWIASSTGLYTFDGNTFTEVAIPGDTSTTPPSVRSLLFGADHSVWVFTTHGGATRIRNGQSQYFNQTDAGVWHNLKHPQQAPDGDLWAVLNEQTLVKLGSDSVWHKIEGPLSVEQHITNLFVDGQGTVWVVANDRLYRRSAGAPHFEQTGIYIYGSSSFVRGNANDFWVTSAGLATSAAPPLHLQHIDADGRPVATRVILDELGAAAPDPDGSLWLLTTHSVLAHLPPAALEPGAKPLAIADSQDHVELHAAVQNSESHGFFRSSDGSVWIGGVGGVERFGKATLVPLFPKASPGSWDQCVQPDGTQWIIDPLQHLYFKSGEHLKQVADPDPGNLYCSPRGTLLVDSLGLALLQGDRVMRLPTLPGFSGYGNHYIFTGAIWMQDGSVIATAAGGAIGRSLWRFAADHWTSITPVRDIPEITSMRATPGGSIYLGLHDGSTAWLVNDTVVDRRHIPGSSSGITGFVQTRYGIVAYGVDGIALERPQGFTLVRFARPELKSFVTGVVEALNGDLWLNASKGIVRIGAGELQAHVRDPNYPVLANSISEGDFVGPSAATLFSNRAQRDPGGRLWFSTLDGIVSVDPRLVLPARPPTLLIRGVLADGRPLQPDRRLPPAVSMVSISYIGVDFTDPLGLAYSYKLQGYDDKWQDVGSRTEAIYTHLKAGRYTFAVTARNGYGVWTDPVVLEAFSVEPHLYETLWFRLAASLVGGLLVWFGFRLRLRFVAREIRLRAEERADERVHIARDLHDTLLQGVQGLLLSLHAATERVPAALESKAALERALASAEKLVVEGRDRVMRLRTSALTDDELLPALHAVANDLGIRDLLHLRVSGQQSGRKLTDAAASETFLIAREALANVLRHAEATRILVHLRYQPDQFIFECEDNGLGFAIDQLTSEGLHWGIQGMRERAYKISGILEVVSQPNRGTTVRFALRSTNAYLLSPRFVGGAEPAIRE